ncbi:right-handed parallel beta-helix repeat-containing protein [Neobacillus vireti]|uniref:right-handed parallel beta-helix repeat-containing protein n=1 Tax=Neobacillus vireti TaxID=220686 RepID=UPI002FFF5915
MKKTNNLPFEIRKKGTSNSELAASLADIAKNVTEFGVSESASDNATSLTNAFNSGFKLIFPKGKQFKIQTPISITSKNIDIDGNGATIVQDFVSDTPIFQFTTCDNLVIRNLKCTGNETYTAFAGADTKPNSFIKVVSSNNISIKSISVTQKSYAVIISSCSYSRVEDVTLQGVLTTYKTGANYSSCCRVESGTNNILRGLIAKDCGTISTSLSVTERLIVSDCVGENLQDNGVYVSSGNQCIIKGIIVNGAANGMGVKVRGSYNEVFNCNVTGCQNGYSVTGNGLTPDSFGANGYGNIISNCIARNCLQYGITASIQDNLYQRNVKITNNTLIDCATTGGSFSAILVQANFAEITNNQIINCDGAYGIYIVGASGALTKECHVVGNTLTDVLEGIRTVYVTRAIIKDNIVNTATTHAIELRFTTDSLVNENIGVENVTGNVVYCTSTYTNTGNTIRGNKGNTISVDSATNTVMNNTPPTNDLKTAITSAPQYIGQVAKVGTITYISVGTASTGDWIQVSN